MRLRELREDRAYSQRELAEKAGIGADTVYRLERSERSNAHPRTVRRLAEALGIEPHVLKIRRLRKE